MTLTFDGPIPGSDLPLCSVLRCDAQGAFVVRYEAEGTGRRIERLMCAAHVDAVRAGEAWRWDDEQNVFLMGADRVASGAHMVSGYRFEVRTFETDTTLGSRPIHLYVEVGGADGAHTQDLHLEMSQSIAADLAKTLTLLTTNSELE
ncbi:hypothetical protein OMK64_03445 [Cellulomonas fimi]|uniref:hypothetical protein n=1 Tax=Cellulomonas fimi TaxID=1708 RepID=UPI00234D1A6A|nr:hypothetical protein [Cellulomonas fimi]MDC7120585.1 hypothetical protein [Cellulomonas fimi]